jgi:uncharacterized membrane protein YedE/YeeE
MDFAPLALVALGAGLGFCLIGGGIGFAGPYRRLLEAGTADGVRAQLVFLAAGIALHALAIGPGGYSGGFVAPAGIAVVVGAFVFGIGMQMANGCGSGTLAALGAGSLRMRAVLPTFVAGAFAGSLAAPFWADLPAFPASFSPAAESRGATAALLKLPQRTTCRLLETGMLLPPKVQVAYGYLTPQTW